MEQNFVDYCLFIAYLQAYEHMMRENDMQSNGEPRVM